MIVSFFLVDDYLRFSFVEAVPSTSVPAVIDKLDQLLPHLGLHGFLGIIEGPRDFFGF